MSKIFVSSQRKFPHGGRDIECVLRACSYNPYTEPSMEIFSYHKGLNKLIEIGNSGIFRPEMLEVSFFLHPKEAQSH
jgi:phenylalanyl-tRNA synthetase alpha subunit